MDGVENMDGEFEQTTLHMFIDCTFQPTFLHSDTPHTAFQNFEETITELAAVLTVLTSAEGLTLEGEGPSVQGPTITLTGYFNQLLDFQNENLLVLQRIHLYDEQNSCNQCLIPNSFNGIKNQPSPHPALVHQNPVHARSGNSDRAYSSGQFAPPQRPELFPQHNHTSNSNAAWNSSRRRFRDKLGKVEQVLHPKEHKGLQRVSSIEIKTLSAPRRLLEVFHILDN
ncbi:hypothetical protein PHAVU_009G028000 [Phaseolus vulgaris]